MSFPCVEPNCTGILRTQAQLSKHKYDHHTLQTTAIIQNTSYTTDKTESGFICPKCNQTLKTTSTFNRHVDGHNKSLRGRKEKRVGKDACLSLKTKLPKTFSESDIKTAQNASNEIKTLTKPIATLAAAGRLEYTIQDQQKTLVLTEITNLTPIGLLSKQQPYYLLGSPSHVQEIHEKQPKVIFSIPPDPSHLPKHHVDSFIEKKALENYQDDGGELAATVKEVLKLFGQNERISIIGNKDLDKHLQSIAKTMNSSITAANQVVKERLSKIFS